MQFLSRSVNQRDDEYGGSLENRVRLFREVIEETKEAVGDTCAVVVRFAVGELLGPAGITSEGEGREVVHLYRSLCRVGPPGIRTLRRVGDCLVPSTIAQAVWDGHRAARELEGPSGNAAPLKLEYVQLEQR